MSAFGQGHRHRLGHLVLLVVLFLAAAPIAAETIDGEARLALSPLPRENEPALDWLIAHGDTGTVAVLIQLLRWQPEEGRRIVAGLEQLTGAQPGQRWFDWMVWQQGHPEIRPYPGYAGFAADLFAILDPQFRRFIRAGVPH
ncbi:MAG: hypothetical protein JO010_14565, partial [Alphaproteobacteria bacterium]|nr:hypothetical protein [Alphaproteobacteria bacterium]